ncbi:MAG: GNAT family N-acetyltransferase [Alphaproteobacteria bacterium]|nr:GNAT family N-acetyltransferase [Alphaproteobacteria bacterium]
MPQGGSIFGYSQLPVDHPRGHILNTSRIKIRGLTSADAAAYRDIRLAGLKDSPEAFGSTFGRENAQPLAWFSDRLRNFQVFGAFRATDLLGIAGFVVREGEKERHKGLLWGMYVRPDARKTGVGRRLVEAVIDFARQRVELLQLSVVSDNEPARRLYARLGFVEYGVEKKSLKHDGRYYDEILMALDLMPDAGQFAIRMQRTDAAQFEEEFAK